jgi:hypothetical protein
MIKCWGNSPSRGKCINEASHFYISLIPASEGIIPANRAACENCSKSFRFDLWVRNGLLREVSCDEFKIVQLKQGDK